MIQFNSKDYPNLHLDIIGNSFQVIVTLNITPEMVEFLSKNNVVKSKKHFCYVLKSTVLLAAANEELLLAVANRLVNTAMISCRVAKQEIIDRQIARIKLQTPRITSSNSLF